MYMICKWFFLSFPFQNLSEQKQSIWESCEMTTGYAWPVSLMTRSSNAHQVTIQSILPQSKLVSHVNQREVWASIHTSPTGLSGMRRMGRARLRHVGTSTNTLMFRQYVLLRTSWYTVIVHWGNIVSVN